MADIDNWKKNFSYNLKSAVNNLGPNAHARLNEGKTIDLLYEHCRFYTIDKCVESKSILDQFENNQFEFNCYSLITYHTPVGFKLYVWTLNLKK